MSKTWQTVSVFAYSGLLLTLSLMRLHQIATSVLLFGYIALYIWQRSNLRKGRLPLDICAGFLALLATGSLYFGIEKALM